METFIAKVLAGPVEHLLQDILYLLVGWLVLRFNKLTGAKISESQAREALHTDELVNALASQCVHAVEDRWANAVNSEKAKAYISKAEHASEMLKGRLAAFGLVIDDSHVADAVAAAFQREIGRAEKWFDQEAGAIAAKLEIPAPHAGDAPDVIPPVKVAP